VKSNKRFVVLRLLDRAALAIDRRVGWWRLPLPLGLAVLVGLRNIMRERNLFYDGAKGPDPEPANGRFIAERTPDGSFNDPAAPRMGIANSRFGRNTPPPAEYCDPLTEPNPHDVSKVLFTRRKFIPAGVVNALSATWLQFMVRDWFHHVRGTDDADVWVVSPTLSINKTPRDAGDSPGYINVNSHWWDASQLYGNTLPVQHRLRTHIQGKLHIPERGELPITSSHEELSQDPGFWLGLAMLQILFSREHNAICDRLVEDYPEWTDEELFQRARLINAALIAKIHILEWTPALIARTTTRYGMNAIWYGLQPRWMHRRFGRLTRSAEISGVPGSKRDHFGVPYAITEDFSAVYRMHPLIPDDWTLRSVSGAGKPTEAKFRDLTGVGAADVLREHSLDDLFYSFGVASAGALTLGNFPQQMQEFRLPTGKFTDLAATDILRIREFGVPRYNEFRRRLGLKPAKSIRHLNAEWADEITRLYGDIEQVDLMVGLFAEKLPRNFAFSDTAFRIFLLMASRRLNSDRFFTDLYRPEIYTQAGLDWVEQNSMTSVLTRHLDELRPVLDARKNPFHPKAWK
jgi:hypothetical protein